MKKSIVPAMLSMLALPALAGSYQFELAGTYNNIDIEGIDTDTYGLIGAFYFNRVDDSVGPIAEAAFLNKASSLNLGYATSKTDVGPFNIDGDAWQFGGRGVFGEQGILQGSYTKADVEGFNTDTFNIGGGAYLDDHSTLLVSYRFVEDEFDNTDHGLALDYKNVMPLQGDTALNIEAGIGFINTDLGDDVFSITGLLDYYFNPKFSLGGGLGYASAGLPKAMLVK